MTIVQKPSSINLSGNLPEFILFSDNPLNFVLKIGDNDLFSGTYTPGNDRKITINVKEVIESVLSFQFRNILETYTQDTLIGNFTAYINDEIIADFRVIKGGVSNFGMTAETFLQQHFLTWQPRKKKVSYSSPEYLSYYAITDCRVKLKAYISNTSSDSVETIELVLAELKAGNVYTIPMMYAYISGKLNKYPSSYDVWIESTDGSVRYSYIQRYEYEQTKSEQEEFIIFENSLGGVDCFRAYGNTVFNAENTHNIATINEQLNEYRIDTEYKYTKNTGYLNQYEQKWLKDFFPSTGKYIYKDNILRKIVITEDNVSSSEQDAVGSYEFTYRYADDNIYLNLPIYQNSNTLISPMSIQSDNIDVIPELEPRMAEFPMQELSDGSLFPVQEPFSERWHATNAGAIANYIIEKINQLTDGHLLDNRFKGYFLTETSLKNTYPNPLYGESAWVGVPFPGVVYTVENGQWETSGKAPEFGDISLEDYATKEELSETNNYTKKITTEYNVSTFHPTSGISGGNKYDLASAIGQVPAELRADGLTVSFINSAGDTEKWEFGGGSWAIGGFAQVGAKRLSNLENDIHNKPSEDFIFENLLSNGEMHLDLRNSKYKSGHIKSDGTIGTNNSAQKFVYYEIKIPSIFLDGTLEYQAYQVGSVNIGAAFYDSKGEMLTFYGKNSNNIYKVSIPSGATLFRITSKDSESYPSVNIYASDTVMTAKKIPDYNNAQYDHDAITSTRTLTFNVLKELIVNKCISYVDGSEKDNNQRAYISFDISSIYEYGLIEYPNCNFGSYDIANIAFYDIDGAYIKGYTQTGSVKEQKTIRIPIGTKTVKVSTRSDIYTDITIKLNAIKIPSLAGIKSEIELTEKTDMLPIDEMDNLLIDYLQGCGNVNVSFDHIEMSSSYGYEIIDGVKCGVRVDEKGPTIWRIKKDDIMKRIAIHSVSGNVAYAGVDDIPKSLLAVNNEVGKIVYNDEKIMIIYANDSMTQIRAFSKENSSWGTSDVCELKLIEEYCSRFVEGTKFEDIDISRRYYSRSQKLMSKIRGKNAIVYADSLSAFIRYLQKDWGLNIFSFASGGCRMGYEMGNGQGGESGSADNLWLCNDRIIQTFNENKPDKIDFIIVAALANTQVRENSNAENVQFVLENKRWYGDTSATNPFDVLEEEDKKKFTSAACTYAAIYSLCSLYPGACCLIAETYRTPGPYSNLIGSDYTEFSPERYARAVFNQNLFEVNNLFQSISRNIGAIWVPNKTRDNIANVPKYHPNDGVHPSTNSRVPADLATNIAIEMNMIF